MAGTRNKAKLDEVRDEEGRRRFHGAFTGGFSAGYYNSVGSKEGWQPRAWQSSRGTRGAAPAQRPEDFMDEEDGLLGRELEAQLPYDTLGEQARRLVREQAGRQAAGAAIPGIEGVDELLAPTGVAIGKKLLQLMGWKEGLGVGSRQTRKRRRGQGAEEEEEDEEDDDDAAAFLPEHLRARAAERGLVEQGRITFARRDVESFALPAPKDDLYGLGFDPDKHAPEFAALREAARARDDRGVYRMGDVKGHASSSRAGPRDATGFALDDSEDDVYDADAPLALMRKERGGGGGGAGLSSSRYDTVLRGLDEEEEEEEEARGRRGGKDAGAAHRMALEEWIGGAGTSTPPAAPSRCPTDSRPVPEGFVLGVARWAFKQAFWAPPTPPRGFVPFHRFEEEADEAERRWAHAAAVAGQRDAHRGRLVASARGTLLGEAKPEPPREGSSVFDLMSEADRGRLLGKAQALSSSSAGGGGGGAGASAGEGAAAAAAPMALAQGGVFQGMQGALAKRFSVVEAPKTATLQEGLIEGGKGVLGGIAPSIEPLPPKPLKEPTRSQALWYPGSLLCKRFGVPVPQHAKLTPAAAGAGAGAGVGTRAALLPPGAPAAAPASLLSNKFDQEMAAILPGGNLLAQQQQAEAEAETAGGEEEGVEAGGEDEAALPAFEAKPRPAKDIFKAIFEASDSEEEDSAEDEEESDEEEGKPVAVAAVVGAIKPEVQKANEPRLAGDAPTPPRPGAAKAGGSPPRDHFLQPAAVAEGESIEEILARGPVLIPRKKRAAAAAGRRGGAGGGGGDGEDEEEEEGLVFGAAVIKKQPKKRPKPAAPAPKPAVAAAGGGPDATPPTLRGADETPPPGSTLSAQAGVPPTPPRAAAVASGEEEALAILSAPAAVPPVAKQEDGDGDGSGSSSDDGSESEEDGGAASASAEGRDKRKRGSSSRSRHKKEKKRRKESKKDSKKDSKEDSKKRKHKKEERRSRRDDDDDSRGRKKRSKHSTHSRSHSHSHRR